MYIRIHTYIHAYIHPYISWVKHKLEEIKSGLKKDYERNNQYVKFFKKVNKQMKKQDPDKPSFTYLISSKGLRVGLRAGRRRSRSPFVRRGLTVIFVA